MKSNWEQIKLADLFELQMGKTPAREKDQYWKNGNNKWISIADISKFSRYTEETKEKITDIAISESGIKQVPANTLIMSFKLSLGKVAITSEPIYTNEAIMAFIDLKKRQFSLAFLFHLFKNKDWSAGTNKAVLGMTLNKATLKDISIPVPPLPEQEDIAQKLDTVCRLITLREQQLQKLDQLASSRFSEMFDGTVFPSTTAEGACSAIVDCPHSTPSYEGEDLIYPAIRTSEISNGDIDWTTMRYVSHKEYIERTRRLTPLPGDIVYAREGTYGDCVILPPEKYFCLGQRTMLFRPNLDKCVPIYLHSALRSANVRRQADASNAGSTVPHVNVGDAKKFTFPLPPLSLQNEFAAFIEQLDKSKVIGEKQGIMLEKITCHDIL